VICGVSLHKARANPFDGSTEFVQACVKFFTGDIPVLRVSNSTTVWKNASLEFRCAATKRVRGYWTDSAGMA